MEPLFFKAENCAFGDPKSNLMSFFNGAAFFQSGKLIKVRVDLQIEGELQWSRFFSKRKISAGIRVCAA